MWVISNLSHFSAALKTLVTETWDFLERNYTSEESASEFSLFLHVLFMRVNKAIRGGNLPSGRFMCVWKSLAWSLLRRFTPGLLPQYVRYASIRTFAIRCGASKCRPCTVPSASAESLQINLQKHKNGGSGAVLKHGRTCIRPELWRDYSSGVHTCLRIKTKQ